MEYFTTQDNFQKIIENTIGIIDELTQISTGWTNFVFRAEQKNNHYIFRFPRNTFFSRVLEKEYNFCKYIRGKISFATPDLQLHYNTSRPFTVHSEIPGTTLTEKAQSLNEHDKHKIAKQVSQFIYELQNIDMKDFKYPLPSTYEFLVGLSKVDNQHYDYSQLEQLNNPSQKILSHADLNPGNILLDKDNNICAILDFAFVSYSNNINDISRLIGRLPNTFYDIMLAEFDKMFHTETNKTDIANLINIWDYVEFKYKNYMRANHPEIKFE